jgi:hypothetical protein
LIVVLISHATVVAMLTWALMPMLDWLFQK